MNGARRTDPLGIGTRVAVNDSPSTTGTVVGVATWWAGADHVRGYVVALDNGGWVEGDGHDHDIYVARIVAHGESLRALAEADR